MGKRIGTLLFFTAVMAMPAVAGPSKVRVEPSFVIGQPDLFSGRSNAGGRGARTLNLPSGIATDGRRLAIADSANHRVLIWNSIPVSGRIAPDVVLGQRDFVSEGSSDRGCDARTLDRPTSVAFSDGRFFVADTGHHRVLIWGSVPSSNDAPADVVVGQPDFSTHEENARGVNAAGLSRPAGVAAADGRLFIADTGNHRLLVWNSIPSSNGTEADIVLGQPDLAQNVRNNGGRDAATMESPKGVASDGRRLIVCDTTNNRVLIWLNIPDRNGLPADVVLGQTDFDNVEPDLLRVNASTLLAPSAATVDGERLFVADTGNHRVLQWDTFPVRSGAAAAHVFGQPDFSSRGFNHGGVGPLVLNEPTAVTFSGRLFIADRLNHRVLAYPDTASRRS